MRLPPELDNIGQQRMPEEEARKAARQSARDIELASGNRLARRAAKAKARRT